MKKQKFYQSILKKAKQNLQAATNRGDLNSARYFKAQVLRALDFLTKEPNQ